MFIRNLKPLIPHETAGNINILTTIVLIALDMPKSNITPLLNEQENNTSI